MQSLADDARTQGWVSVAGGTLIAGWALYQSVPLGIAGGVLMAVSGILMLRRRRLGLILDLLVLLALVAAFGWMLATKGVTPFRVVMLGVFAWLIYSFCRKMGPLLLGNAGWDDPLHPVDSADAPADDEQPLISIVLLQRRPKFLDERVLAELLEASWGGDFTGKDDDTPTFVVGESPMFMIRNEAAMWCLHNFPEPYADRDEMAESVHELRLRKALLDHEAWLAVDLLHPFNQDLPRDVYYPYIFQLIGALADDDTLAIYRPETGDINVWSEDILPKLLGPDPLLDFNHSDEPGVLPVSEDDPSMQAAVAEARARFPEFREAWNRRTSDENFTVKAPVTADGNTEFIWLEVTGLEPDYIHGTLANDPVDLGDLRLGSPIEVPVTDLNDWCFFRNDNEKPSGLFTVEAVARAARQHATDDS